MKKRGFVLGKFMPPHAGHMTLIEAARTLVDELTILLCSLPDDPISGEVRLDWIRRLFPDCRIRWQSEIVPQQPGGCPDFWPVWTSLIADHHPEPIDFVFAGEAYGAELANRIGGTFVPLGGRVLSADRNGVGGLSGDAIRADPWRYWDYLPHPVRDHYALTICLHGIESVGKSSLAERLAEHYSTTWVPEYGRSHCEAYGTNCSVDDLLLIGQAQQAMIAAARPWANRLLIADTDALMTAAWSRMMIGYAPDQLTSLRKSDLYLMLGSDAPFTDDGTRVFKTPQERQQFEDVAHATLVQSQASFVEIKGSWDDRFNDAVKVIDGLAKEEGLTGRLSNS